MDKLQFKGSIGFNNGDYQLSLTLLEFKENDVTIVYSPALDLSGYGYSTEEAKNSFNIVLVEFLRYTHNKKTFEDEIKKLGWKIKGKKNNHKFLPPLNSELIERNTLYSDIVNSKNYKAYNESIELSI